MIKKNQKNILKVRNKLLERNELKNIKIDDSISIKNVQKEAIRSKNQEKNVIISLVD